MADHRKQWSLRLKRIFAYVLLGVMTNLVAIVAIAWVEVRGDLASTAATRSNTWVWQPPPDWPPYPMTSEARSSFGRSRVSAIGCTQSDTSKDCYMQTRNAFGFPVHCVVDDHIGESPKHFAPRPGNIGTIQLFEEDRIESLSTGFTIDWPRTIPLTPHWPGMLINIATYGTLWALLFATIAAIRRGHLRARGLCLHCKYDMNDLAKGTTCPECGHLPASMQSESLSAR